MSCSARLLVDHALDLVADGVDPDEAISAAAEIVHCSPAARSLARTVLIALVTRPATTTSPEASP